MSETSTASRGSGYAWVIVISAMFWSGIIFGLFGNTVGLFYVPVATNPGQEGVEWTQTEVSLFMSIFPIVAGVLSPIIGKVYQSVKKTQYLLAGTALAYALTYLWSATFTELWQWNLYGVITGIYGGMLMYIPIPMLINNWFTKQKGIALGLAASFVNFMPAIFSPVITAQIAASDWRTVRIWMAIIIGVIVTPLTLIMVRKTPEDKGTEPWGGLATPEAKEFKSGVSNRTALKSVAFWLAIIMVACIVSTATMYQRMAAMATAAGFEGAMIGFAPTALMLGAVFGKYLLGFIRDITKSAVITGVVCACLGLLACVLFLAFGTSSIPMFYTSVVIYGLGFAGLTVVPPIVVENAFGGKSFAQIFANVSVCTCVASSGASLVYAQIIDQTGGYEGCFYFAIALYAIFLVCVPLIIKLGQALPREAADEPADPEPASI
ncbi:MAG: MFS transporter [Propionibacteriaceae bacterium]|jgi:MFS family permease|nr:MFS transporter [Propionibacteriaceae bacterium]